MKAIVAQEYGGPEVLKLEEVARPVPKENEALVRVIASGVNPADPLIVSGKLRKNSGLICLSFKPVVTQTLPLAGGPKALQQAATHHTRGKMVLKIADEPKS